jgi:hypothetical protein
MDRRQCRMKADGPYSRERRRLAAALVPLAGGCTGTDAVAQDRERTQEPEQEIREQLGEVPAVVDTVGP